jgi:hypothetical protein
MVKPQPSRTGDFATLIALGVVLRHNEVEIAGADDQEFHLRGPPQNLDGLIRRCVLDERDVMNTWRSLFVGKETTSNSLAKAEAFLDGLSGESPLHIRLAKELEELRELRPKK